MRVWGGGGRRKGSENCLSHQIYFTEDRKDLHREAIGPKGSDCFSMVRSGGVVRTSISKETYSDLGFSRVGWSDPCPPPLWIRPCNSSDYGAYAKICSLSQHDLIFDLSIYRLPLPCTLNNTYKCAHINGLISQSGMGVGGLSHQHISQRTEPTSIKKQLDPRVQFLLGGGPYQYF